MNIVDISAFETYARSAQEADPSKNNRWIDIIKNPCSVGRDATVFGEHSISGGRYIHQKHFNGVNVSYVGEYGVHGSDLSWSLSEWLLAPPVPARDIILTQAWVNNPVPITPTPAMLPNNNVSWPPSAPSQPGGTTQYDVTIA